MTPPPEGEPEQPQSDERWPGWLIDAALTAAAASAILAGLSAISGAPLVRAFLRWAKQRRESGLGNPNAATTRGWLAAKGVLARVDRALKRPTEEAWTRAWAAGQRSALAVLEHGGGPLGPGVSITVDWGQFEPGNTAAARKIIGEDGTVLLRRFMAEHAADIKGISDTQLEAIARTLAEGLEKGWAPEKIGQQLQSTIEDRARAFTIAWTETNRAMSAAALDTYAAQGVRTKGWLTAFDQRVCPRCMANEEQGFIPLGATFTSGDKHPPGHPRCRCAPIPGPVEE